MRSQEIDFAVLDAGIEDDREGMLAFLKDLVACPLPSSDPLSGANAQVLVEECLRDMGFEVVRDYPVKVEGEEEDPLNYKERYSVVGRLPGRGGGRSLVMNSHADVVGYGELEGWTYAPDACTQVGDRLYGRGVVDARGCLVTYLFALKALLATGWKPAGDILFQSVGDEEILGKGTEALVARGYVADAALVGEPTGLTFQPATRGAAQFYLDVKGKATHSGVAYEGENAILHAMKYIEALTALQGELDAAYLHPLWASYPVAHTVNIALIQGGESASRVPASCTVSGLVGCIAGESVADIHRWVQEAVERVTEEDPWLRDHPPVLRWAETMSFEPSASAPGDRFFQLAERCSREVLGGYSPPRAFTAVSDLRYFLQTQGAVGANFGPGDIKQAHAYDECGSLEDMVRACKLLTRFIYRWTGGVEGEHGAL